VAKYPEKFTKARFIVPINREYGGPVGSDAGGICLKLELDTEVLPTAECNYIFCFGPPKQSRGRFPVVWLDHQVSSQPPIVALQGERHLLPPDWDFLALPHGTIKAQAGKTE
jgi:hypothetical protein